MPSQVVICVCGRRWEWQSDAAPPSDLRSVCPTCAGWDQHTAAFQASDQTAPSSKPSGALHPTLAGFEVLEEINRGGMGVVYRARQLGLNRIVALKVIQPDRLRHPDAMSRFQREVRAAALLAHPNIVTVFHTDLGGPLPFLAMEFVDGIDLLNLVQKAGPLPIEEALVYVRQAALGLQHAFEQGLVHRDIKPANLMVTPSPLSSAVKRSPPARAPTVKILDMGLARVTDPDADSPHLTQLGEFLGTADYISPEQAEDPRQADIRADLYSLGCTLFYLLTGEVPFPGGTLVQKLRRQLTQPVPRITDRKPGLPRTLADLVARLMAKTPEERFRTPADLLDALEAYARAPAREEAPLAPPGTATPSGAVALEIKAHPPGVQTFALSAEGSLLLTGGLDGTLRLWDARKMRPIRTFAEDAGSVSQVAFSPSAKWAASCALRLMQEDMVVQLWDVATGTERRRLRGATDNVTCVSVSPEGGKRVAAGGLDRVVRVWNLEGSDPPLCLTGHTAPVSCVRYLPHGMVLSASHDDTVRLWDAQAGTPRGTIRADVGRVLAIAVNGMRLAVAGDAAEQFRLRQPTGAFVRLIGHEGPVTAVAFAPDGRTLLSGGADGAVMLWRVTDGAELARFDGHTGKVTCVAFAPDGRVAYSGSSDGTIRRWPLP